jgi:hypothetical protein
MIRAIELWGGLVSLTLQAVALWVLVEVVWFVFAKATGRKY